MRITGEIEANPGWTTLFVAEIRFEKSETINKGWWGFWISWWLYKPAYWRIWLWSWENFHDEDWHTWEARLLGFEINWQRRLK